MVISRQLIRRSYFQLLTPIDFRCIYAIGLNYRAHARNGNGNSKISYGFYGVALKIREIQLCSRFLRSDSKVDFEAELELSLDAHKMYPLRRLCRMYWDRLSKRRSARDWQRKKGRSVCRGKTFDTFSGRTLSGYGR